MKQNTMELTEADRIGTALWRSSIPQKYKKYPILGQGATSIVLDKGDGRVLMLTRDTMKMEWLTRNWGLDIGEVIDEFEVHHQKSRTLGEMPVYVIDLPLLYPLSAKNKQLPSTVKTLKMITITSRIISVIKQMCQSFSPSLS